MVLTDEEVDALRKSLPAVCKHQDAIRAAESAVLEKLKAQAPFAYFSINDYGAWEETSDPTAHALYEHPLPPDDVVQEPDKTKIECVTGAIYKHISGELYPREVIAAAQYIAHRYCTPPDDVVQKYGELLYAVHRKFPDETRHQTALRYIKTAESPSYTNAAREKMK